MFYYLLTMSIGFITAVMLVANGELTAAYGPWLATVIIHVVGLAGILAVYIIKRGKLFPKPRLPFYYFLGGAIGVATTLFCVYAFGVISVSAMSGLGLLGQALASLVIDHFGLAGMKKRPFNRKKLLGFAFLVGGILLMLLL